MEEKKLFEELRDLGSCQRCRDNLERFPSDGEERYFALACAPENKEFIGCDDCLREIIAFVRSHP
jgi:hypothetical protein